MPGDPKDCRDHAKACIRLATSAKTTEAAIVFENLASTWLRLAADLETSAILLADLEEIDVKKTPPSKILSWSNLRGNSRALLRGTKESPG
jgi:hypothetical protein